MPLQAIAALFLLLVFTLPGVCLDLSDPGDALKHQADDSFAAHRYSDAITQYKQLIAGYPSRPYIAMVKMQLGEAYFYSNDFTGAVSAFAEFAAPNAPPDLRSDALYYTGLAQLYAAAKPDNKTPGAGGAFQKAIETLSTLLQAYPQGALVEDTLHNRGLAYLQIANFNAAEADIRQLLQQFPQSLSRPEYQLLLGTVYAARVNQAINDKQPTPAVQEIANKGLAVYDQLNQSDPTAVIIRNQAALDRANLLYIVAQLNHNRSAYEPVITAYRQVQSKAVLIPLEQQRIDRIQKMVQTNKQNNINAESLTHLAEREEGRLAELQKSPDPVFTALEQIAVCYNVMQDPDSARTVLHRLVAAGVPPEQQKSIDLQLLQSYVLSKDETKASAHLDDFLQKYPGDPEVQGISYQQAQALQARGDNNGALRDATRSLTDFPKGKFAANALSVAAQALNGLGRSAEVDAFVKAHSSGLSGGDDSQLRFATAQAQEKKGDLEGALAAYHEIMARPNAGPYGPAAAVAAINLLQGQKKYDQVMTEAKNFAEKFPTSEALVGVLVTGAAAQDSLGDHAGALTTLEQVIKAHPQDQNISYALYDEITIAEKIPEKLNQALQAFSALVAQLPQAAPYLPAAAQVLGQNLEKQSRYADAAALYQQLIGLPDPDNSAYFQNKVGDSWLAAATHTPVAYESMQNPDDRKKAEDDLTKAEGSYQATLANFPNILTEVGNAIQGLINVIDQRQSWKLIGNKPQDVDAALAKMRDTEPMLELKARLDLARAGLVLNQPKAQAQYPAALATYKQILDANSGLKLTRQEAGQFGRLLIAAQDFSRALDVYNALLAQAKASDALTQVDATYGLAATYLAQQNWPAARDAFAKLFALNPAWHPDYLTMQYGQALAQEKTGDTAAAKAAYAAVMQDPNPSNYGIKAESMLGYGRILEAAGHVLKKPDQQDTEYAAYYDMLINNFIGSSEPELSAEGLYRALHLYLQAGDRANAQKQMDALKAYQATAPDWFKKASAEMGG